MNQLKLKVIADAAPLLEKRAAVVKGDLEAPADIQLEEGASGDETGPSGIPSFWLNVLRANPTVGERVSVVHLKKWLLHVNSKTLLLRRLTSLWAQITEKDEQVLEYLIDVQEVDMADNENGSFMLAFHFAENPFFENKVLVGDAACCLDTSCHSFALLIHPALDVLRRPRRTIWRRALTRACWSARRAPR